MPRACALRTIGSSSTVIACAHTRFADSPGGALLGPRQVVKAPPITTTITTTKQPLRCRWGHDNGRTRAPFKPISSPEMMRPLVPRGGLVKDRLRCFVTDSAVLRTLDLLPQRDCWADEWTVSTEDGVLINTSLAGFKGYLRDCTEPMRCDNGKEKPCCK